LYDTFYISLCLFANKYLNDADLSKDAVQEVFIKIWENKTQFKNRNNVKSYLYTSVKNKALDYLKNTHLKTKSDQNIEELKHLESDSFFSREVVIEETFRMLEDAVNTLPKRCKSIIELSLLGYKNEQISETLLISVNTVKAQKRIAYTKLRPLLKNHHSLTVLYSLLFTYL